MHSVLGFGRSVSAANIGMANLAFALGWLLLWTLCAASNARAGSRGNKVTPDLVPYSTSPTYQRASADYQLPAASNESAWPLEPSPTCRVPSLLVASHVVGGVGAVSILVTLLIMATAIQCPDSSSIGDCHQARAWKDNIGILLIPAFMGLLGIANGDLCNGSSTGSMSPFLTVLKFALTLLTVGMIFGLHTNTSVGLMVSVIWGVFAINFVLGLFQAILIVPAIGESCGAETMETS